MDNLDDFVEFLDEIEHDDQVEINTEESTNSHLVIEKGQYSREKLSAAQKFAISIMIFFLVLVTGLFILLITGKMGLPF